MYGFTPTDEQKMLVEAVGRYAKSDLRPAAHEAEEGRQLPPRLVSKGWELGVLQASVPGAYGGFLGNFNVSMVPAAHAPALSVLAGPPAALLPSPIFTPPLLACYEEPENNYILPLLPLELD